MLLALFEGNPPVTDGFPSERAINVESLSLRGSPIYLFTGIILGIFVWFKSMLKSKCSNQVSLRDSCPFSYLMVQFWEFLYDLTQY